MYIKIMLVKNALLYDCVHEKVFYHLMPQSNK